MYAVSMVASKVDALVDVVLYVGVGAGFICGQGWRQGELHYC